MTGRGAQPCDTGKYNNKDTYRCVITASNVTALKCIRDLVFWMPHWVVTTAYLRVVYLGTCLCEVTCCAVRNLGQ